MRTFVVGVAVLMAVAGCESRAERRERETENLKKAFRHALLNHSERDILQEEVEELKESYQGVIAVWSVFQGMSVSLLAVGIGLWLWRWPEDRMSNS